jgi:hypothetical protein
VVPPFWFLPSKPLCIRLRSHAYYLSCPFYPHSHCVCLGIQVTGPFIVQVPLEISSFTKTVKVAWAVANLAEFPSVTCQYRKALINFGCEGVPALPLQSQLKLVGCWQFIHEPTSHGWARQNFKEALLCPGQSYPCNRP